MGGTEPHSDDGTDGYDLMWSPELGRTILVCNHNFGTWPDIPACLDCGSDLAIEGSEPTA